MLASLCILSVSVLSWTHLATAGIYDSLDELGSDRLDSYDYVIVGGGLAGSVLANRLSEDSSTTVLLVEAGPSYIGEEALLYGIEPLLYGQGSREWVFNYTTAPQRGLNGRSMVYPQGHVLGGGSSVNGLVYTRGSHEDWDKVASLTNDSRWSWDVLLPYFKKIETFVKPVDGRDPTGYYDPAVHGTEGPLRVGISGFTRDSDRRVLATIDELKEEFYFSEDLNDGVPLGVGYFQGTFGGGQRNSAANSYLSSNYLERENLHVVVNTQVSRILGKDGVVYGIEIQGANSNNPTQISASREVIVSTGSSNTPRLLLLSGIGDAEYLTRLNISVLHDLPDVGKNFTDSWEIYPYYKVNSTSTDPNLFDSTQFEAARELWSQNRTGALSSGWGNFMSNTRMNESDPEVKALFEQYGDPSSGPDSHHIEFVIITGVDEDENPLLGLVLTIQYTTSRGSITLNETDPTGNPVIDPAHYTSESPYEMVANKYGVRATQRFLSASAWDGYILGPTPDLEDALESDEALDAWLRDQTSPGLHGVGSSMMSPKGADYGVVDPDLRVKGLEGLRVVDCGVLPFIPAGHTQSPVYVVAERAADIIKEDARMGS